MIKNAETEVNDAIGAQQPQLPKLDYTLETPEERNELVKQIIAEMPPERLTERYLEILSDYIIFAMDKQERKEKKILTSNRMVTVNKRETSYQGLVAKLENGEDGVYNLMAGNDKNIIFAPKVTITEEDIEEIPGLKELRDSIARIEKEEKAATGKRKFILKKQLIEMRQEQYILKSSFREPMHCMNLIKSFHQITFDEKITVIDEGTVIGEGLLCFFNPAHISALLCNYYQLKDSVWGKFNTDAWCMMQDLDHLIEITLKEKYPVYYDLVFWKAQGYLNAEIQKLLKEKHKVVHSAEYISSLWRQKIPKLMAEKAQEIYLVWYFSNVRYGRWKKCSRCGQIKLANNRFYSKNKSSRDGFYSICKDCRNAKTAQTKKITKKVSK